MRPFIQTSVYRFMRSLVRIALKCFFGRIEYFNRDRVPPRGPVLFASNHPNSVTDAFVIGISVPRKIHFVATVQLFWLKPLKWCLLQCGVVPINRLKDNPRGMRSVLDSFEACYSVLEKGEAIGLFPEGITHDDPRLRPIKTGPARMALELEHRHQGKLGLQIIPVGLTFAAKEKYRSPVLVHFGNPIRVADFVQEYGTRRKECIQRLSAHIEQQIQSLILHIPQLERARVVEGVKRLYLEQLRLGNMVVSGPLSPQAEELILTQAIASAVDFAFREYPEQAAGFVKKLDHYEQCLRRMKISDEAVVRLSDWGKLFWQNLWSAGQAILGAPIALYGLLHCIVPLVFVRFAVRRYANVQVHKAQIATTAILAGIVSFGPFFALLVAWFHFQFGWPRTIWYAASLPVSGLFAHFYFRDLRRLRAGLRNTVILLRGPMLALRLLQKRAELIRQIDEIRAQYRNELLKGGAQLTTDPGGARGDG